MGDGPGREEDGWGRLLRANTQARALFCMPVSIDTVLAVFSEKPIKRDTRNLPHAHAASATIRSVTSIPYSAPPVLSAQSLSPPPAEGPLSPYAPEEEAGEVQAADGEDEREACGRGGRGIACHDLPTDCRHKDAR